MISIVGLIGCSIFLPDLFAITGMSTECIMLFVVFSIATEPVLRYLTMLVGGLRSLFQKIFHRKRRRKQLTPSCEKVQIVRIRPERSFHRKPFWSQIIYPRAEPSLGRDTEPGFI